MTVIRNKRRISCHTIYLPKSAGSAPFEPNRWKQIKHHHTQLKVTDAFEKSVYLIVMPDGHISNGTQMLRRTYGNHINRRPPKHSDTITRQLRLLRHAVRAVHDNYDTGRRTGTPAMTCLYDDVIFVCIVSMCFREKGEATT